MEWIYLLAIVFILILTFGIQLKDVLWRCYFLLPTLAYVALGILVAAFFLFVLFGGLGDIVHYFISIALVGLTLLWLSSTLAWYFISRGWQPPETLWKGTLLRPALLRLVSCAAVMAIIALVQFV